MSKNGKVTFNEEAHNEWSGSENESSRVVKVDPNDKFIKNATNWLNEDTNSNKEFDTINNKYKNKIDEYLNIEEKEKFGPLKLAVKDTVVFTHKDQTLQGYVTEGNNINGPYWEKADAYAVKLNNGEHEYIPSKLLRKG